MLADKTQHGDKRRLFRLNTYQVSLLMHDYSVLYLKPRTVAVNYIFQVRYPGNLMCAILVYPNA